MRLFVAIDLPENIISYFKSVQAIFNHEAAKLKLTNSFHLTLKFFGEIDENKKEEIVKKLDLINYNNFKLKIEKVGVFPNLDYIKIIWVGLEKSPYLIGLQKEIETKLEKFHFKKDFEFYPHITLARVSFVKDKQDFKEIIQKINLEKKEFEVFSFNLYSSILTREGPIYNKIKDFKAK